MLAALLLPLLLAGACARAGAPDDLTGRRVRVVTTTGRIAGAVANPRATWAAALLRRHG